MAPKFLRTDYMRFSKIGKGRKKLQVWRRARGKHSKIRRKRKGYPAKPTIGYRTDKSLSGRIEGKIPILIHNIKELSNVSKDNIIIIARIGAKKKLELIKKAKEMNLLIDNIGGKNESK